MSLATTVASIAIRRRTIQQMTTAEVEHAVVWAGRNAAPSTIFDLYFGARVPDVVLRDVLIDIWTAAEFPERFVARPIWLHWFEVANRVARYPVPADPIRIYRGAISRHARGMSWTTDRDQAHWFANRFTGMADRGPGNIYQVVAPPHAVLADIDAIEGRRGRGEHEIIVDPRRLPRVSRVREYARRST